MKLYTVKCPLCGTVNQDLYLDETDGFMECEHCHQVVKAPSAAEEGVVSIEDFAALFRPANLKGVSDG